MVYHYEFGLRSLQPGRGSGLEVRGLGELLKVWVLDCITQLEYPRESVEGFVVILPAVSLVDLL